MFGGTYCFITIAFISSMGKMVMCQSTTEEDEMSMGIAARNAEFTYLCTVVHQRKWVGACSIISREFVIVSVGNMNKLIKWKKPDGSKKRFYNELSRLKVYAGSIHMVPPMYEPHTSLMPGLQEKQVDSFYVAYNYKNLKMIKTIRPPGDRNFDLNSILYFDVVDAAFNVGFLKVSPFQWSSVVKPIPLVHQSLEPYATRTKVGELEQLPFVNSDCKIAAWHEGTFRKIFHHVLHIPRKLCRQAYCNYNFNACLMFPNEDYHVCFKSAFWGEPCEGDTGAALFCKFFEGGNIFAILTTAIKCGRKNLPCVYTTMNPILQVFQEIGGTYDPSE